MMCLACGSETGAARCAACGEVFSFGPPHARPSHVSQAQEALAAVREGRLTAEAALTRWNRFLELAGGFQERWGQPLGDQLDPMLRPRFGEAVAEMDAAWTSLEEAASHVSAWSEGGPEEHLAHAESALVDFFRRACGGCAWVEKELVDSRSAGSGSLLDVRSD